MDLVSGIGYSLGFCSWRDLEQHDVPLKQGDVAAESLITLCVAVEVIAILIVDLEALAISSRAAQVHLQNVCVMRGRGRRAAFLFGAAFGDLELAPRDDVELVADDNDPVCVIFLEWKIFDVLVDFPAQNEL